MRKLAGGVLAVGVAAEMTSVADLRRPTPLKESFVYKQVDRRDLTLDVYPPGDKFPAQPQPAIVFIHGGGWGSGSTDHFAAHCRYFAARGMVTVNVLYRLTQGTFPGRPGVTIFDCIADAQDAVKWVRAHSAQLGIDPQRIVAAGDSAGGHLAAATGILPDPRTGKTDPGAVPNALVLYNPVLDLVDLEWTHGVPGIRELPKDQQPAAAERASPLRHIRRGLPPTIILHGTEDKCVPVEQARQLQQQMTAAGNRCDLVVYPGVAHAFVLLDYYPDEAAVVRAIVDTDRFLESLGYVKGPPTLAQPAAAAGPAGQKP